MANFAAIRKLVRKAVESPLFTACAAADPPIPVEWPNLPFDRSSAPPPPTYINVAHSFGTPLILEMGKTPLFEVRGSLSLVIRTPSGLGVDYNDDVAAIAAAAYPYGETLTREGVSVDIDKIDASGYGVDGAWSYSTVTVNWTVYRRN